MTTNIVLAVITNTALFTLYAFVLWKKNNKTIRNIKKAYNERLNVLKVEVKEIRKSDIVLENALDEMEQKIQHDLNTQMNWDFVNNKRTINFDYKIEN